MPQSAFALALDLIAAGYFTAVIQADEPILEMGAPSLAF